MRESIISVPHSNFIKKSDWALKATDNNVAAAELLNLFIYHFDYPSANGFFFAMIERMLRQPNVENFVNLEGYQPYSLIYLEELLMNTHSIVTIRKGLAKLSEIEFISLEPPAKLLEFYSSKNTWVKLLFENIYDFVENDWKPNNPVIFNPFFSDVKDKISEISLKADKVPKERKKMGITLEQLNKPDLPNVFTNRTTRICEFDRHIHGRAQSYVYDKDRRKKVADILKHFLDEIETLAQGIIGFIYSDYHWAKDKNNMLGVVNSKGVKGKLYIDIDYIFKNMTSFQANIRRAEEHGVTREIAKVEFEKFLRGEDSQYCAKLRATEIAEQAKQAETIIIDSRYREFANQISRFFLSKTDNKIILEMAEDALRRIDSDVVLSDPKQMEQAITESASVFEQPSDEVCENIIKFAEIFCEKQELNNL